MAADRLAAQRSEAAQRLAQQQTLAVAMEQEHARAEAAIAAHRAAFQREFAALQRKYLAAKDATVRGVFAVLTVFLSCRISFDISRASCTCNLLI
jgi:hypothetical protein